MLAALAVGGWVFIGFDACGQSAEETRDATRHVPRAVWIAMLSVGALVILNAVAIVLAHPDPAAVVGGRSGPGVHRSRRRVRLLVRAAAGSRRTRGIRRLPHHVAEHDRARDLLDLEDGVLPGSGMLRRVSSRQVPLAAIVVTVLLGWAGLLLGLEATGIGSLLTFGTAGCTSPSCY